MTFVWQYCIQIYCNVTQFPYQTTTNEPNNSNIWCNGCNQYGILCVDSDALSACAEQMPIVPAAPLIMTGIIVIEMLSHCCAHAELHGLTGARLFQRALGRGVTADRKDRTTTAAHQRAPIRLFWNIYDPCCFLGKPKNSTTNTSHRLHFFSSPSLTWLLLTGAAWTKMSPTTFMLLLSLVPRTGAC